MLSVVAVLASSCGKPYAQPTPENSDINSSDSEITPPVIQDTPCNNIFYPLALDNQWI